jgi:hypothetical protein
MTRYFRSWMFNAGLAFMVAGVLAWHHSVALTARDMGTAGWHTVGTPSGDGPTITFRAGYRDLIYDPWLPLSVILMVGGFGWASLGAWRVTRQR